MNLDLSFFDQSMIAFIAGLFSFFTPCVFPMIPVFLIGISQSTSKFWGTVSFAIGITLAFLSLGLLVSAFGAVLEDNMEYINIGMSILLILFGVFTLIPSNIPVFSRTFKLNVFNDMILPIFQPFLTGFTFAFGWSPCVGPVLAAVLGMAVNTDTLGGATFLLGMYSLGMCLPLFLFSLIDSSSCLYQKIKHYTPIVEKIGGICLIVLGFWNLWRLFH